MTRPSDVLKTAPIFLTAAGFAYIGATLLLVAALSVETGCIILKGDR